MFPDEEGTETMHPVLGGYHVRGSTMFPDEEGTETTYFRIRTPKPSAVRRCSTMRRGLKPPRSPAARGARRVRRCSPMRRGLKQELVQAGMRSLYGSTMFPAEEG